MHKKTIPPQRDLLFISRYATAIFLAVFVFLLFAIPSMAENGLKQTKVPDDVTLGLDHLLSLVQPDSDTSIDLQAVEKLLDFVASPKNDSDLFYSDKKLGAYSAYYEFDIQSNLEGILQYAYNPDIPSQALMPSAIRLCSWTEVNGQQQTLPKLWSFLPTTDEPVIVKGTEHIEVAPNKSTGAYFRYDTNKALILCKYQGRNLFISISKQKDTSDVGRKGFVLGTDEDWNYVYSGEKGLAKKGLGWVDSYMYDSFGISVFYEVDASTPLVKCGSFRWLRAGWANLNMIKKKHIHKGLIRWAKDFKGILEHPSLPEASELAQTFSYFETFSHDKLKAITKKHLDILEKILQDDDSSSAKHVAELIQSESYLNQMTAEEMQSIVVVEYMKSIVGKEQHVDDELLMPKPSPKLTQLILIPYHP